jgi:hypothetical protein
VNRRKLINLLAQLSFEAPKRRRNKQEKDSTAATKQPNMKKRSSKKKKAAKNTVPTVHLHSPPKQQQQPHGNLEYGIIVADDHSSSKFSSSSTGNASMEIYFDAPETYMAPRESIVLASISATGCHPESYETILNHQTSNHHQHHNSTRKEPTLIIGGGTTMSDASSEFSGSSEEYSNNSSTNSHSQEDDDNNVPVQHSHQLPAPPPLPPTNLPLRFLRAGKNNREEGLRRYQETLQWRSSEKIDIILREPSPNFDIIKRHYPHFHHLTGKNGEPCFYEQPPKTDLKALRAGGVTLAKLLRHYTMITEFQWQYLQRDDLMTSIYVIDLDGIRLGDFVGEVVDFVKTASKLSAQHYPERAGCVFVINVPAWFKIIWSVVKPIVDVDTLKKIYILRGKEEIRRCMQEKIALENIPPEYGGNSMPLGQSPEEASLRELMEHNNRLAEHKKCACDKPCHWCSWVPARAY